MENNLISRKELCEYLGFSEQTIRNYEKAGMPVIHAGKGRPRYDLLKVINWMAGQDEVGIPE